MSDITSLSDDELKALARPDISKLSDEQLKAMHKGPDSYFQGLRDPIDAGAQLLTHVLPDSVVDAGNEFNNWLADKTGLVGKIPERNLSSLITGKSGGLDQMIADQEKSYQASRTAAGQTGIDWKRLAGNIASPANLAIASKIPAGVGMLGRIGSGVASGAVMGATSNPVTEGDFWSEKRKQAGLGALTGGVLSAGSSLASKLISPDVRPNVKKLLDEGVTPTPGQILGGWWQATEDKLTSVPLLGDAIQSSRGKGLDEFNRAAYARALKPIGAETKQVGREAITEVKGDLGKAYDNILPFLTFKADNQFAADFNKIRGMASSMPETQANQFEKILREKVISRLSNNGSMDGEAFKGVESELGRIAKGYKADPSFDNRQLGDAIGEMQSSLRDVLVRSNPQYASALKQVNEGYANYARIRDAASRQGSAEGKFTPSQLAAAVRAQDKSVGKSNYAQGKALMQDLSDAGKDVLAPKYPDSGSAGRLLMGAGTAGAGMLNPYLGAGIAGSTLPYLPGGRQAIAALLARRPDLAKPVASSIQRTSPFLIPAGTGLMNQVGNGGQ